MVRTQASRLFVLLGAAAAVRGLLFTGLTLGDDVFYLSAASALAEGQGWPPLPLHWHTRLGMTVPTAVGLYAFGWHPFVFVWLPFAASLAGIWVCYRIVAHVAGQRAGWIAAILYAAFPLEIIYSTHLFPDLVVGLLSALAVWFWYSGFARNSATAFFWSGVAASAGYLCRETVFMLVPVFAAIWLTGPDRWRPRLCWAALAPALTLVFEAALYAYSTGDGLYRWRAMAAQQANPENLSVIATSASGGGFWTDPLLMLVASHEFSVIHALALPLAVIAIRRRPELRWVAVWLIVGLAWLYYGTTIPTGWVTVQRDPRYAASFTIPAVLLIAVYLADWTRPRRAIAVAGLVALGVLAATLDQRGNELTAHRTFSRTDFADAAALEPFEYYGARWVSGLHRPAPYACASDAGRRSVADLAQWLPGGTIAAVSERRYFVFSPTRRPDLVNRMSTAGWQQAAEITGVAPPARRLLAQLLRVVPTQAERASRLLVPPRLVILEHPRWRAQEH